MLASLIRLYDCYIAEVAARVERSKPTAQTVHILLECTFLSAVIWSIGACTALNDRPRFSADLHELCQEGHKKVGSTAFQRTKASIGLPIPQGQVFNFDFDIEAMEWVNWTKYIGNYSPPPDTPA
eukprot:CAMPEP_0183815564 /NCGR_PEP_ID=MMETSP0803_2-20130417/57116_1 /TAXON_ID=195967 /ORGANISM="Crustomastix stigmata, Strain CCMP3273" /LENGTH=124 /DNA_ID=CAMNT_0026060429 /DNA_START=146 /DNA_END=516 /DNA_ORIENTATION=+